jgi:alpha-D-xyloside xylohydrolase
MAMLLVLLAAAAATVSAGPTVSVRPWGENALRVMVCADACSDDLPGALDKVAPGDTALDTAAVGATAGAGPVTSGNLKATTTADVMLEFSRVDDGAVLLRQTAQLVPAAATGGSLTFDFSPSASTVFGMGQNRPGNSEKSRPWEYDTRSLDVRNQVFDFKTTMGQEGGATNSAPFIVGGDSSGGWSFGLLFNSPSYGGMNFTDTTVSCSTAPDSAAWGSDKPGGMHNVTIRKQLDFLIVGSATGSAAAQRVFDISKSYTAAVGRTMKMPLWGSQYWHCKNRYSNQTQLLIAARYFHKHNLTVGVLVIDWFHWKLMGDWSFDETYWPDVKGMVEECASYNIHIMASVWPFSCEDNTGAPSRSYGDLVGNGYVATDVTGKGLGAGFGGKNCRLVDPTNPDAAKYVWSLVSESYYKHGIKSFWLDNSEPWTPPALSLYGNPNATSTTGWSWADSGALFDVKWPQLFHDGLVNEGETEVVTLPRAGW